MAGPIDFYFDFASPYAWFSMRRLEAIAQAHGREICWRPILLWAVRQAFDMKPPMQDGPKAGYLPMDMARSAAFHGAPFVLPDSFGRSSHHAARLFYGLLRRDPGRAPAFARAAFAAHFSDNRDISDAAVLAEIGAGLGIGAADASALMSCPEARDALTAANDRAIAHGVWGSPWFVLDGEGFFGADRLPQLDWRLAQATDLNRSEGTDHAV